MLLSGKIASMSQRAHCTCIPPQFCLPSAPIIDRMPGGDLFNTGRMFWALVRFVCCHPGDRCAPGGDTNDRKVPGASVELGTSDKLLHVLGRQRDQRDPAHARGHPCCDRRQASARSCVSLRDGCTSAARQPNGIPTVHRQSLEHQGHYFRGNQQAQEGSE